jgi:hypothetical protein
VASRVARAIIVKLSIRIKHGDKHIRLQECGALSVLLSITEFHLRTQQETRKNKGGRKKQIHTHARTQARRERGNGLIKELHAGLSV